MSTDPLQGVLITSREIYDAVVRLTGRVDTLIQQAAETAKDVQDHETRIRNLERHDMSDHEARIRILERARWPRSALSVISVLIALASLAVAILVAMH